MPGGHNGAMRSWRWATVRGRIMVMLLVTTTLVLATVGALSFIVQRNVIDERIDATLTRSVAEFRQYISGHTIKADGTEATAAELLYAGMMQEIMAENEGMLGFVDGRLAYSSSGGLPLGEIPEFVAYAADTAKTGTARITSVTIDGVSYRFAVVPVTVTGQGGATLIVAYDRTAEHAPLQSWLRTYLIVSAGALVVLALAGWGVTNQVLRPLRQLRNTAESISETDLARRIDATGDDEIADLSSTFDAMLDRLEGAFEAQRQLLDDAGHELRTPLTIVQGHLEVMDPDDPADTRETRELVLSEVERMRRLTEDLVLLAKTDQPDFIQVADVDLRAFTDNVFEQAQHLGERAWHLAESAEGHADVDDQRLTGAWLELAKNAVKHSQPGSAIELASRVVDSHLLLSVRDEGEGIAPADLGTIFERFRQTGTNRSGAGLGLSIVAAVAQGHGGTVTVESTPGIGSVFTIVLPLAGQTQPREAS